MNGGPEPGKVVAVEMRSKLHSRLREVAAAGLGFSVVVLPGMGLGMTTDELADALRKARLPEAGVVSRLPGAVEEESPDFLGGGRYVKVTLDDPSHSHVLQFVHQGAKWVRIPQGVDGLKRLSSAVQLTVKTPDAALRYVQWALDTTASGPFWRLGSVADVPFLPASEDETDLKQRLAAARSELASKVQAPKVEESGSFFVVHQDAVVGRDLVRYTVNVSKLGAVTVKTETVARDLPVVSVGRG